MAVVTVSATGPASGLLTVPVTVDLADVGAATPLTGSLGGLLDAGPYQIVGNVSLTEDLVVEATVFGIDSFDLDGNGFQILVQNGGRLVLEGVEKSGWVRWGDAVTGWEVGDRLAVAPTAAEVFLPLTTTWDGSWAATIRPANTADVTLPDASVAVPEVANLDRSIVLHDLRRIHFHDGAGVQSLKYLAVVDAGTVGVLADYPLHFHLTGETTRTSLVEGVVVERGMNHAFVPHGAHGITFIDCVAYQTTNDAYWWDLPLSSTHTANNSDDTIWQHCLALYVIGTAIRRTAFMLGAGARNEVTDSVASCLQGGNDAGGFAWPENANQNIGGLVWIFEDNVSHNNKADGIFAWQNDFNIHIIERFVAYRNGRTQVDHGAYGNHYEYHDMVLMGGIESAFMIHAQGPIVIENVVTDGLFISTKHRTSAPPEFWVEIINCAFTGVVYTETADEGIQSSQHRFIDCGLVPADFDLAGIVAASKIEIIEGGILVDQWVGGDWL